MEDKILLLSTVTLTRIFFLCLVLFQDAVKVMAKDLVRTRRYVKKFISLRANIQAVSLKIQTLKANNTMAQAMKGVTKAMATMNKQVNTMFFTCQVLQSFCVYDIFI